MKLHFRFSAYILVLLSILSCEEEYVKPIQINYHKQAIDSTLNSDNELNSFIAPYRDKISSEMQVVLSYAPADMYKSDSKYNTAIGNMMADAVMQEANLIFEKRHGLKIDAVLLNYGGIRSGISKGDITVRTAYDIMPFENEIVVVELSHKTLQEMLKYIIDRRTAHPIAGMTIRLNHDYSLNSAIVNGDEIKLNDTKEKSYYIATSDYLFQGGDGMNFFKDNKQVFGLDYKLRNILIDYFKKQELILSQQDTRFTVGEPRLN